MRKPRKKSPKEQKRTELLTNVARIFAYWDHEDICKVYARKVVEQLIDWKLVDAVLPLREPKQMI